MPGEVQIQNVSKNYRVWKASLKVQVLNNLSLNISEGEAILLLGPNGSGKSTLLRMIATLLMPSSGKILICGYDTRRRSRNLLNMIGYMPEECKFHSGISGLDFLYYLGKLMGIKDPKTRALEKIERFGLTKWSNIDASIYSEGMRQRLGLCSAVLNDPKILLLDEPSEKLDKEMREDLKKYLREYVDQGNIVIVASHNHEHFPNYKEINFPID